MKRTLIVIVLIAALIAPIWAENPYGTTPDGIDWEQIGTEIYIMSYSGTAVAIRIPERINNFPVTTIESTFSRLPNTNVTSVIIPNTVTWIKTDAFRGFTGLTSVTLGTGLTRIDSGAFWGCTALRNISIPASVTTIGSNVFNGCSALTTVAIPTQANLTIGRNAFLGTNLDTASRTLLQGRGYSQF